MITDLLLPGGPITLSANQNRVWPSRDQNKQYGDVPGDVPGDVSSPLFNL